MSSRPRCKQRKAAVDSAKAECRRRRGIAQGRDANTIQAQAAAKTVAATRGDMQNAQALLDQAQVQLGLCAVVAPIAGKVNVRAARQGEVVAAGTPIVTVTDLTQTWIYAPLPETEADAVQLGDSLRVVMPSGATHPGQGDCQIGGSRLCHAARCEPAQAGYRDDPPEAADRQSRRSAMCRACSPKSMSPRTSW